MKACPVLLGIGLCTSLSVALLHFLCSCLGLGLLPGLGLTAAAFLLGRLWRQDRAVPLSIPGLALCFITAIRLHGRGESTGLPGLCALVLLLFYLLSMHGQGMREGLHNMPGEPPMPWPRGIRGKNLLLILAFFGLCLAASAVRPAERGAERLWNGAVSGMLSAAEKAAAGIRERTITSPSPGTKVTHTPEPTPELSPEPEEEKTEEQEEAGPLSGRIIFRSFAVLALLLALAAVIAFLMFWMRNRIRGRALRDLLDGLIGQLHARRETEPYIEEREKLRSWRSAAAAARRRLMRGRGAGKPRVRLQSLPDDRTRVRYAWRALQQSPAGRKCSPALTPGELGAALGKAEYRALAEQYNLARYAPGSTLAPDAGKVAAAALRALGRSR